MYMLMPHVHAHAHVQHGASVGDISIHMLLCILHTHGLFACFPNKLAARSRASAKAFKHVRLRQVTPGQGQAKGEQARPSSHAWASLVVAKTWIEDVVASAEGLVVVEEAAPYAPRRLA